MSAALLQLRQHCDAMRDAIGETLRRVRANHSGRCVVCGAAAGVQHASDCPLWPLILAHVLIDIIGLSQARW